MKKTLYIHIGRPKVGSSAIQQFLWKNRDAILEQGCFYPVTGRHHRASHGLSLTLQPNSGGVKKFAKVNPETLYRELIQEIGDQETADRAVLSSENFYFVDPKKVGRFLGDKFNVKIICCVRSQADVMISSYIQELKEDKLKDDNIENYIKDRSRLKLIDYHETLGKWARIFGRENIIVRPYEQKQFKGGDIFRDISHVIGVDVSEEFDIPSLKVNPSPSSDVLDFIKRLHEMGGSRYVVRQLVRPLLDASEFLPKELRYDSKRLLSAAQRNNIASYFSESNEKVAREFLGRNDGELFYEKDNRDETIATTKEFTTERFVTVAAKLFLDQQADIANMQTRLSVQNDKIQALADLLSKDSGVARETLTALEKRSVHDSEESPDESTARLGSKFRRWFS